MPFRLLAGVEHVRNRGMFDRGGGLRLTQKAPGGSRHGRDRTVKKLQGDVSVREAVPGLVDRAHASTAEHPQKLVFLGDAAPESRFCALARAGRHG